MLTPGSTIRRRAFLGLTLALPASAGAQPGPTPLGVGQGQRFRTLRDAIDAARPGDTIEIQPGEYRGDVVTVSLRGLTIRGLGTGAVFHADGKSAEGKATMVVRGDVVVENLAFHGSRVPDRNGAGIRFERGRLIVRRCRFIGNEMGLLTGNDPDAALEIEDSEFGYSGADSGFSHNLYAGRIARLTLMRSYLHHARNGHLLKSRAAVNDIRENRLDDRPDGEASYEIEFPEGGRNTVVGNRIAQSAHTQNPTMLSMGAEARDGMKGSLRLERNTFINAAGADARFVQVWTERLAGETAVRIAGNVFLGPGPLGWPPGWDGGGNRQGVVDGHTTPLHR